MARDNRHGRMAIPPTEEPGNGLITGLLRCKSRIEPSAD
jgi:hypothetical protein